MVFYDGNIEPEILILLYYTFREETNEFFTLDELSKDL